MGKIQEMANRAAAISDLCQLLAAVEAKAKVTVVVRLASSDFSTEFELDINQSQQRELIEPTLQRLTRQVGLSIDGFLSALSLLFDGEGSTEVSRQDQDITNAVDVAVDSVPQGNGVYGFNTSDVWYTTLHPGKQPVDEFPGPRK